MLSNLSDGCEGGAPTGGGGAIDFLVAGIGIDGLTILVTDFCCGCRSEFEAGKILVLALIGSEELLT